MILHKIVSSLQPFIFAAVKVYKPTYALLGDVGGTYIRLQLVLIQPPNDIPLDVVKTAKLKVKNYDILQQAIKQFLIEIPNQAYPQVVAIAIAGHVKNNKVSLANVQKWGQVNGNQIGINLNIETFTLLNDFVANSYGLLLMKEDNFISLNGFNINNSLIRCVLGPGTGLGCSIIYKAPFRKRQRTYILPTEGGHTDFCYIDNETLEYFHFFKQKSGLNYISLQRSFCGPALPYMFRFFASKNPSMNDSHLFPTSQQIVQEYLANPQENTLYSQTIELFLKLYSNAIANFIAFHLCDGGIYLVGSLTNLLLEVLQKKDLLKDYKYRHPQMYQNIKNTPIVVSKQVDLGLKGAYVYARRIIADKQHD